MNKKVFTHSLSTTAMPRPILKQPRKSGLLLDSFSSETATTVPTECDSLSLLACDRDFSHVRFSSCHQEYDSPWFIWVTTATTHGGDGGLDAEADAANTPGVEADTFVDDKNNHHQKEELVQSARWYTLQEISAFKRETRRMARLMARRQRQYDSNDSEAAAIIRDDHADFCSWINSIRQAHQRLILANDAAAMQLVFSQATGPASAEWVGLDRHGALPDLQRLYQKHQLRQYVVVVERQAVSLGKNRWAATVVSDDASMEEDVRRACRQASWASRCMAHYLALQVHYSIGH